VLFIICLRAFRVVNRIPRILALLATGVLSWQVILSEIQGLRHSEMGAGGS
jgi:hypothetical protein